MKYRISTKHFLKCFGPHIQPNYYLKALYDLREGNYTTLIEKSSLTSDEISAILKIKLPKVEPTMTVYAKCPCDEFENLSEFELYNNYYDNLQVSDKYKGLIGF